MARKNVLDNMPKLAAAMVKSYSATLGPMPADELDIVEIPEYGFGISSAGVVLLTTEAYKPHQDEIANYLARESTHGWPTKSQSCGSGTATSCRYDRQSGCPSRSPSTSRA
jgi:hypothetical protein